MTVVPPALPCRACNKCLKESHEFTCPLLAKADMRVAQIKQTAPEAISLAPAGRYEQTHVIRSLGEGRYGESEVYCWLSHGSIKEDSHANRLLLCMRNRNG